MSPSRKPREHDLLEKIRRKLGKTRFHAARNPQLRIAIGDDAAVWKPLSGYETILTCDWFLEGTHFLPDRHPPHSVAAKCLARAISDIAAMGGEPRCFLLSLALPAKRAGDWLEKFLSGLRATASTLNCAIAGGDTTRSNQILINITVLGESKRGLAVLRGGARPGDAIFVTGRLGEAEYGLRLIKRSTKMNTQDLRLRKHLFPEPRLSAGSWLAKRGLATAMMDLSDGLSTDLPRLCKASNVGARLVESKLPCVQIAENDRTLNLDPTQLALHGGDDYELLFTVSPKNLKRIPKRIRALPLTRIGEIASNRQLLVERPNGIAEELKNQGWDPFQ